MRAGNSDACAIAPSKENLLDRSMDESRTMISEDAKTNKKVNEESLGSRAHPWHGVTPQLAENNFLAFIETTPFDLMKYELDKETGLMRIDQPLETSSLPPSAYGFIPRTLCGRRVAKLSSRVRGDRAPLDVFVLSERPIQHHGVLCEIRVVGGIPLRDESFVDDKLIAVLTRDSSVGSAQSIAEVPIYLIERLTHFLSQTSLVNSPVVGDAYDRERAEALLYAGLGDYEDIYGV